MTLMTKEQFLDYWLNPGDSFTGMSPLDECYENLFERESQFSSECAMFGDAGPGQGLVIHDLKVELASVKRQIERLQTL